MSSPFTIKEIGEPGSQTAVADFTCPRCGQFSRFTARDEDEDGGFTCRHCGLEVKVRGTRLSDYQQQLAAIDSSLHDFAGRIRDKVQRAAKDITEDPDGTKHAGHGHGGCDHDGCDHDHGHGHDHDA